jgi:two-component system, NtrC family, response regulator AtoC
VRNVKANILLVDDDSFTRQLFTGLLRGDAFELQTATNVLEARRKLQSGDFNLVILDQRLPDGNGLDFFSEMRLQRPQQIAILITGHAKIPDAMRAVREGLFDYLTKPFENLDELDAVIKKALEMDRAYREIDNLRETLQAGSGHPIIISRSAVMERLLQQARQVAPMDTTVVIEGESGTGKEVIAKYIHALSARAKGPFLELNCGAVSESLLEATLFGYEKGAFTSAVKTTPGYFEEADGGTLLLDEIADMSPKLQVSLLRVLQERTFARVGSTAQRPSDFRLICATNKSLEAEMKAGRIRSDLYYRINVVAIQIPPLRERREDILALALFFRDHFSSKFGKTVGTYTPEAITALELAYWAGNVRELQNAVERAVVINAGRPIVPADFGMSGANEGKLAVAATDAPLSFREAREKFEREYFTRILQLAGGNVSEAARQSGIARQNFYSHVERLGIVAKS